jgi:steroid delta-isomerase-like uncharacterized protein
MATTKGKPAGAKSSGKSNGDPEQVARSYFEAVGAGDVEAAVDHWHPDGIEDVVPVAVFRGKEGVREFLSGTVAAIPDQELTVQRVTAAGSVAVVEWRLRGTFSGAPFQGIDPTGAHIELRGVDCLEVEDGLIRRNTAYYDGADFARAIGMLPGKDSTAERAMVGAFNGVTRLRAMIRERGA